MVPGSGDAFGRHLRNWRKVLKLTQRQMAERLGVNATYYGFVERAYARPFGPPTLDRLAVVVRRDPLEVYWHAGQVCRPARGCVSAELRRRRQLAAGERGGR